MSSPTANSKKPQPNQTATTDKQALKIHCIHISHEIIFCLFVCFLSWPVLFHIMYQFKCRWPRRKYISPHTAHMAPGCWDGFAKWEPWAGSFFARGTTVLWAGTFSTRAPSKLALNTDIRNASLICRLLAQTQDSVSPWVWWESHCHAFV